MHCSSGCFFFSSRRRHTRYWRDWSSDVCSSDLGLLAQHCSRCTAQPELGKKHIKIAYAISIHFVVSVQPKASFGSGGPSHRIVIVIGILDSQAVFVDRLRVANVVDISDVDGEMWIELLDAFSDTLCFVDSCSPVPRNADPHILRSIPLLH